VVLRLAAERHARSNGDATRTQPVTNRPLDILAIEQKPLTRPEEFRPTRASVNPGVK
jgi:hypothetical protein